MVEYIDCMTNKKYYKNILLLIEIFTKVIYMSLKKW